MTLEAMNNAISLQASEVGATPCGLQDGPTTDLFGQALAPASLSAPPAISVAAQMSATYGLRSSTSSASAALQESLANKLPALLDTPGGTMWRQTWKAKATPQRRLILAHTASVQSTCGSAFTGSAPTPTATDRKGASMNPLRYASRGDRSNLRDWFMSRYNFRVPPARVVRWMMGYPRCWVDLAMPSSRKSRPSS